MNNILLFPIGVPARVFADGSPVPDDETRFVPAEEIEKHYGPKFNASMAALRLSLEGALQH